SSWQFLPHSLRDGAVGKDSRGRRSLPARTRSAAVTPAKIRTYRWLTFLAAALLVGWPLVVAHAQEAAPDRSQQIADLEKQLAELQKSLADLKQAPKPQGPRPMQVADIATWRGITGASLSHNGEWFAYRVG